MGNYNTLQQKLDEIQSIDSKLKTQEQSVKEIEIKQRLEQVKLQADKLKNILKNKVAEKIDTDNIHLKDRESYLLDSYIKGLKKPINSNLNDNVSLKNINEDGFIEGLWDDGKRQSEIQDSEIVEKSQLENIENYDESGIIDYNKEQQNIFDVDSLPNQMHHFATNKNKKYTPLFNEIASKYGLNLDEPWNKEMIKHRGKHPYIYHDYILYKMTKCDIAAQGDVDIFKSEFKIVKKEIMDNPLILRKTFWKGKDNEILFDDV